MEAENRKRLQNLLEAEEVRRREAAARSEESRREQAERADEFKAIAASEIRPVLEEYTATLESKGWRAAISEESKPSRGFGPTAEIRLTIAAPPQNAGAAIVFHHSGHSVVHIGYTFDRPGVMLDPKAAPRQVKNLEVREVTRAKIESEVLAFIESALEEWRR